MLWQMLLHPPLFTRHSSTSTHHTSSCSSCRITHWYITPASTRLTSTALVSHCHIQCLDDCQGCVYKLSAEHRRQLSSMWFDLLTEIWNFVKWCIIVTYRNASTGIMCRLCCQVFHGEKVKLKAHKDRQRDRQTDTCRRHHSPVKSMLVLIAMWQTMQLNSPWWWTSVKVILSVITLVRSSCCIALYCSVLIKYSVYNSSSVTMSMHLDRRFSVVLVQSRDHRDTRSRPWSSHSDHWNRCH